MFKKIFIKDIIHIDIYKVKNYKCGVIRYAIKIDKICTHIILKYVNYKAKYYTIIF